MINDKTIVNLTFTKLIALIIFVVISAFSVGMFYKDFTKVAEASQKNTLDIVDIKILDSKLVAIIQKLEKSCE
jgi:hypothetical protein